MSVSFKISDELVVFKSTGKYEWNELLCNIEEAFRNVKDNNKRNLIFDERDAEYTPTRNELDVIVAQMKKWDHVIFKVALVVSKAAQYGVGRMADPPTESALGSGRYMVFYDMNKATHWLNQ